MPIQIEIQDTHAKLLVDFYLQRLKVLRNEIAEREREAKEINVIMQRLRKSKGAATVDMVIEEPATPYSEKWPWVRKIHFALKITGKPLTTKEIVDLLSGYEANFILDRKKVVASISSVLSTKSGPGKEFIRVPGDSGDFAYTLNKPEEDPGGKGQEHDEDEYNPF
jgi:hypothetical protein